MKKTLPSGLAEELQRFEKGLRWMVQHAEGELAQAGLTWKTRGVLEIVLVCQHIEMMEYYMKRLGAPPDKLKASFMQFFDQFVEEKELLHMLLNPKGHPEGH